MTAYVSVLTFPLEQIQLREPEIFSAGDELLFKKWLPTFLPSNGWSLLYVLTDENGVEIATVTSIAGSGPANNWHVVDVVGFEPDLAEGTYLLNGYAVNGDERRQIYYDWVKVTPNYPEGSAQPPQTTHVQRMVSLLEDKLERIEQYDFNSADVQRNRFMMEERDKTLARYQWYLEKLNKQQQFRRAANGQAPGNVSQPLFQIG